MTCFQKENHHAQGLIAFSISAEAGAELAQNGTVAEIACSCERNATRTLHPANATAAFAGQIAFP
jgi:hypothetical protein